MPLRVCLDVTPLLGVRTGVGRYVEALLGALAGLPAGRGGLALAGAAFSLRNRGGLASLPQGVARRHRPVPARALQRAWMRADRPPVEWLAGRCDVFHATNFVLPPARRAAGVVTVHDLTFLRYPELVTAQVLRYRELVPRSVARAAQVLCPSEAVAQEVAAEFGLAPERVRVTPLGVSADWFAAAAPPPAQRAALGLPERYVLFVGTREPRKNLGVLLRAHAAARAQDPHVPQLVLAGPAGWGAGPGGAGAGPGGWGAGPGGAGADLPSPPVCARPAGTAGAHKPEAVPDCLALGYLPSDALRAVVAGAEAVALPSVYEGFGLPLLEALAAGTRVLASDLPVHREVAGTHARYTDAGDEDGWAQALLELAGADRGDPGPGRDWAARWTWAACAEATAAAYRDAAA